MKRKNGEKLEKSKKRLQKYYDAEEKILLSQSYQIESRTLTRADLSKVQNIIKSLENEIERLEQRGNSKRAVRRIVPKDF